MVEPLLAATHTPVRTGDTAGHSATGPVTRNQVYPSAVRGPSRTATTLPVANVATRDADVSGAVRAESPSTRTVAKPPGASDAGPGTACVTVHGATLPLRSVARTRKA